MTGPQTAQATRFRESHQELSRDFRRVASSINEQHQHARLLPGRSGRKDASDSAEAGLMRERTALDATLSMTDEIIQQAQASHERLQAQRGMLSSIGGKVGKISGGFSALNALVSSISDKKT